MQHVIEIRADGTVVTGHVGPFDNEQAADTYTRGLEAAMPGAHFHITSIISPSEFLRLVRPVAGKPLSYFVKKYGAEFITKLPLYTTAHLGTEPVSIIAVDLTRMEATVTESNGNVTICNVRELDEFVL